jgi:hypothetical protein
VEVVTQAPFMQFLPVPQALPQLPQLLLSAEVSRHVEPQSFWLPEHPQVPPLQLAPAGQTVPQEPQLLESVEVLVQAVPHCVWPELQLELHWLLLQTGDDDGQTVEQLPQWLASDVTHDDPHSIPDEQAHCPDWQI